MSGASTRSASARARKHANPQPPTTAQDYWQPMTRRFEFGKESFRVTAFRKNRPNLILDPLLSQFNWQRQGAQPRTGTLSFYRPLGVDEADIIAQADQIGIDVSLSGKAGPFYRMLRMTVNHPQETVLAGVVDLNLATINASTLTKSKTSWRFGPDRQHPRGWSARQVTISVCTQLGLPMGHIPSTGNYLPALVDKSASGYDVILKAWQAERAISGRRYVVDDDVGALQVSEVGTPRYMLPLGPVIAEATLNSFEASNFASAVNVSGHSVDVSVKTTVSAKKHKVHQHVIRKKSPLQVLVIDHARVARYGYVEKSLTAPANLTTVAELRQHGLSYLARHSKPTPSIEFTHPGIPWVDVGSAIHLKIPRILFDDLVYCQDISHSVGAGQYTMDVTIGYKDPWLNAQDSKIAAAKRARGLKNQTASHALSASARPRTKKAAVHSGGAKK